jgi:hypothetical protein
MREIGLKLGRTVHGNAMDRFFSACTDREQS